MQHMRDKEEFLYLSKILLKEMIAEPGSKHLDQMQIIGNERGREWVIISEVEIKEQRGELGGRNK